jgi:hypothetical protein
VSDDGILATPELSGKLVPKRVGIVDEPLICLDAQQDACGLAVLGHDDLLDIA